jgi:hypothetical protein
LILGGCPVGKTLYDQVSDEIDRITKQRDADAKLISELRRHLYPAPKAEWQLSKDDKVTIEAKPICGYAVQNGIIYVTDQNETRHECDDIQSAIAQIAKLLAVAILADHEAKKKSQAA